MRIKAHITQPLENDIICMGGGKRYQSVLNEIAFDEVSLLLNQTDLILPNEEQTGKSVNVWLTDSLEEALTTLAKRTNKKIPFLFKVAVEQGWLKYKELAEKPKTEEYSQEACQENIEKIIYDSEKNGKIALIESCTGIGKTKVLLTAASKYLQREPNGSCVIAVPTIHLFSHFALEVEKWNIPIEKITYLLGRRQFISPARLNEELKELEKDFTEEQVAEADALRAWLLNNGRPLANSPGALLLRSLSRVAYLYDDAAFIAPNIPLEDCVLDASILDPATNCPAEIVYQQQRSDAVLKNGLVITTHAFLANHALCQVRGNPSPLPKPIGLLLIDEAHSFETTLAVICTTSFTLTSFLRLLTENQSLWKSLRIGRQTTRAADIVLSAIDCAAKFSHDYQYVTPSAVLSGEPCVAKDFFGMLRDVYTQLKKLGKSKRATNSEQYKELKTYVLFLKKTLETTSFSVAITLSSKRKFPKIVCGPKSLKWVMMKLWESVASAALVSGTMYNSVNGVFNCEYMRAKLSVPTKREVTSTPFVLPWLFSPTVHTLKAGVKHQCFSSDNEKEVISKYYDMCATKIIHIGGQAKGGVLVLCNSFDDINSLRDRLIALFPQRLLIQSQTDNVTKIKPLFIRLSDAGNRPIWLGTGSAWTGVDINSEIKPYKASEDYTLTDLVVLRLPFGNNRSSVHTSRIMQSISSGHGILPEICEAQFLLRQGLGRLMRSSTQKDRNIWLLDGRNQLNNASGRIARAVTDCLRFYKNTKEF